MQVLALQSGAMMPLVQMLADEQEQNWFSATDALASLSANDENKKALGHAGAITSLLRRMCPGSPQAVQVRVLATLINVISYPANMDAAVSAGVFGRLVDIARGAEDVVMHYISVAFKTLSAAVRHLPTFVEFGMLDFVLDVLLKNAHGGPNNCSSSAATVRVCLTNTLDGMCAVEALRQDLVEKGAFAVLRCASALARYDTNVSLTHTPWNGCQYVLFISGSRATNQCQSMVLTLPIPTMHAGISCMVQKMKSWLWPANVRRY